MGKTTTILLVVFYGIRPDFIAPFDGQKPGTA
jgi:hypothetical protein